MKQFLTPVVVIGGVATLASFAFGFYCIDNGIDLLGAAAFITPILGNTAVFINKGDK